MEAPIWEVNATPPEQIAELSQAAGVSRPTALFLAARGITPATAGEFLRPSLKNLSLPSLLSGTMAAAARIWQAVQQRELILIHGDYDTDGITASVLISSCLRQNGARVECFIPHRFDDGYGITPESVEKACHAHPRLLITVDCGINSMEAVQRAKSRGIDVIVTDHHEPGPDLPDADVLINPKLPGTPPALHHLAGVGVAFKLCHGFIKYGREHGLGGFDTDLRQALDLVALGTVADIVPLTGENRCLVAHGLDVLSGQQRPGIRALCELSGLSTAPLIRAMDVTFRLAPRLNAAGRLGDPMVSYQLLEASGMHDALLLALNLDEKNRLRQQMEETTLREAEVQILSDGDLNQRHSIMLWNRQWPQGVIGIVASRLVRKYHRPCVILTLENGGLWRGSARSVQRVNLVGVLEKCRHHLLRFGGHPMAAGLTVAEECMASFREDFEAAIRQILGSECLRPQYEICGKIDLQEIAARFYAELPQLEPFGQGNPEPLFLTARVQPGKILPAGKSHSRGTLADLASTQMEFILFGRSPKEVPPPPWDIVFTPQINTYNGNRSPQVQILDLRTSR